MYITAPTGMATPSSVTMGYAPTVGAGPTANTPLCRSPFARLQTATLQSRECRLARAPPPRHMPPTLPTLKFWRRPCSPSGISRFHDFRLYLVHFTAAATANPTFGILFNTLQEGGTIRRYAAPLAESTVKSLKLAPLFFWVSDGQCKTCPYLLLSLLSYYAIVLQPSPGGLSNCVHTQLCAYRSMQ